MDVLIQNGKLVDGTGAPAFKADIAIDAGKITVIAPSGELKVEEAGKVIDASGCIVTPGFIDTHTHYDGQATWDEIMSPSSDHGVTTAIMGNCGIGFAPVRADERDFLIEMMEGVEDIPGIALADGITWNWETFPEYLDELESKPRTIDIATQVPHCAIRTYAMGRSNDVNAVASPEQIKIMADLTKEAMAAGAIGLSTGRISIHTSIKGESVPGTFASRDEFLALIKATQDGGGSIVQCVSEGLMGDNPDAYRAEVALYKELSIETGCRILFLIAQNNVQTELWKEILSFVEHANAEGAKLIAMTGNRPGGMMMSWDSFNIFIDRPAYIEIAELPFDERVKELKKPERRDKILNDKTLRPRGAIDIVLNALGATYPFTKGPLFEPAPEESMLARIQRTGEEPQSALYDAMCEVADTGDNLPGFLHVYMGNYAEGNLSAVLEMLNNPNVIVGGADAGAHVNMICDASYPTYMMQHWVRDRVRGPKMPIEQAIRLMSKDAAEIYGLYDRGEIAIGKKADINIINLDKINMHMPRIERDLPTGAPRLLQGADGYVATLVSGEITFINGVETGARPGGLVRGPQSA